MRRVLGSIFVLTLLVAAGYSQTFRGAINGTVNDPSGAMVSGANVKATNIATSVTLTTTTTSDGQFSFQDLPLGSYRIAVSAGGFNAATVENVPVTAFPTLPDTPFSTARCSRRFGKLRTVIRFSR